MPRPFRLLAVLLAAGCTKDIVLPSPTSGDVCGDGIVGPTEQCDTASPGCTGCLVTPGWQCINNVCFYPCGDGISGTGPTCEDASKDLACDMNGWWISRENDAVRDAILNNPQPASTWYVYRLAESNGVFQVAQALHCGFHVTGAATVDCTPGTLRGLLYENDPSLTGPHPRGGTFAMNGGTCSFTFARFYRVRGGTPALVPMDFSTRPDLDTLIPLPYEDDPLHPTGQHLDNQEDTDGDGFPGAAFQVSGLANGIRESTQRDFKEYATAQGETVQPGAIEFTVHGDWDLQESVLSAHDCGETPDGGEGVCPLLVTPGHVDNATLPPSITMRYLGSTLASPRVASVILGNPGDDVDTDLATCANVRVALPHDPTLLGSP